MKFVLSHSKLRKQPFFAEIFKIQEGLAPTLPTPIVVTLNRWHVSISWDYTPRSLYFGLFATRAYGCYSSCTSRSWWIVHSTQRQRRGCNTAFQINFSHHIPKLIIPVEMVQFLSKLLLKQRFLAVLHHFNWSWQPNFILFMLRRRKFWNGRSRKFWKGGVGVGCRKFWKGLSRMSYLQLRNFGENNSICRSDVWRFLKMTLTRVPVVTDIRDFYAAATVGRQMQPGSEGDEAKPFFL